MKTALLLSLVSMSFSLTALGSASIEALSNPCQNPQASAAVKKACASTCQKQVKDSLNNKGTCVEQQRSVDACLPDLSQRVQLCAPGTSDICLPDIKGQGAFCPHFELIMTERDNCKAQVAQNCLKEVLAQ